MNEIKGIELALIVIYLLLLIYVTYKYKKADSELVKASIDNDYHKGNNVRLSEENIRLKKERTQHINEINALKNDLESANAKIPFTEQTHQCECGNDMRETAKMFICDNCGKRIRKDSL